MNKPDFLLTAKQALQKHYPDYLCAFVAGSMLRGEDTATSDIDIVVLHNAQFRPVHRFSVIENQWPIEFFVHTPSSCDFYMEQDKNSGMCIMMDMITSGILLLGKQTPEATQLASQQKSKAKALIEAGPPPLSEQDLEDRRYRITELLDDLDKQKPVLERYGTLSLLYEALGDLLLRGNGLWSGQGKTLGKLLQKHQIHLSHHLNSVSKHGSLTEALENAFTLAFQGQLHTIHELGNKLLHHFGGRCFEGYCRSTPDSMWLSTNA